MSISQVVGPEPLATLRKRRRRIFFYFTGGANMMQIMNHVIKSLVLAQVLFITWLTVWALESKRTAFKSPES